MVALSHISDLERVVLF